MSQLKVSQKCKFCDSFVTIYTKTSTLHIPFRARLRAKSKCNVCQVRVEVLDFEKNGKYFQIINTKPIQYTFYLNHLRKIHLR